MGKNAVTSSGVRRPPPIPPHQRKPLPMPPPMRTDPPPPYSASTMAPAQGAKSEKVSSCSWSCGISEMWTHFVDGIRSLYHSFISLFSTKDITPTRTLEVGRPYYFVSNCCEHLVYAVALNEKGDLELLGFRYAVRDDEKETEYKEISALVEREALIAEREKRVLGIDFASILDDIVIFARENNVQGKLTRTPDAFDIYFIIEYMDLRIEDTKVEVEYDPTELEAYNQELQALRERLQNLLFTGGNIRCPVKFRFHRFLEQETQDIGRFKRMLSIVKGVQDYKTLSANLLHEEWGMWEDLQYPPDFEMACLLGEHKPIPPELYHNMVITFSLS